ncbi:MAG: ABC transporter ATP-binding protein [Bacteroidetes bacterium]|nr:ABC transporter ATP-binding protein [Bacteroidota bacterium]MCH8523927.1 ABC transporter ATP-binding protein [Balneolales bacterium]
MIEIKNLKKSFGDNLVWENVNLTIEDGTTLAIVGKSGCGKSVLLKHLNALLYPDEGEVLIKGRNVFQLSYVDLRIVRQKFGVLFQGAALFDSISAFENIAFPLRYFTSKTEKEIRSRVMDCLEMVNLSNIGNKGTSELSGGMRKRVGLARAIVLEPEYLLYDEPTSGLDPETSDEINDLIIHMTKNLSITSVVISHDMHSVLRVAEHVVFLDEQKLSWQGSIDELRVADHKRLKEFTKASEYQI